MNSERCLSAKTYPKNADTGGHFSAFSVEFDFLFREICKKLHFKKKMFKKILKFEEEHGIINHIRIVGCVTIRINLFIRKGKRV